MKSMITRMMVIASLCCTVGATPSWGGPSPNPTGNVNNQGNTATGGSALGKNTTGSFNTATGVNALSANTTGLRNTAISYQALLGSTTGAAAPYQ